MADCLIHLVSSAGDNNMIEITERNCPKLKQFAERWAKIPNRDAEYSIACDILNKTNDEIIGRVYHRVCYQKFCNSAYIKRFENQSEEQPVLASSSETRRKREGIYHGEVLPPVCIICGKKEGYFKYHNRTVRDKLLKARTVDGGQLRKAAEVRKREDILLKIRCKDLVALEAQYHRQCYIKLTKGIVLDKNIEDPAKNVSDWHYTAVFEQFCETVIEPMIEAKQPKTLITLHSKFISMAQAEGHTISSTTYKSSSLKKRLEKRYPLLQFHQPQNKSLSTIVYTQGISSGKLLEHIGIESSGTDTESDVTPFASPMKQYPTMTSSLHELYTQCLAIREEMHQSPDKLGQIWPPTAQNFTDTVAREMIPISLFNSMAWILGMSNEPTLEHYVPVDEKSYPKLMSILQDMLYLHSHGRKCTPKHYCIGMAIRHLTGSTRIIELLNHFGHCASRDTIVSLETALAQVQANKDTIVPQGFELGKFATVVSDNIDFGEETLSGYGTSHYTNSIIIQRNPKPTPDSESEQPLLSGRQKRTHTLVYDPVELEKSMAKRRKVGPRPVENIGESLSDLSSLRNRTVDTLYCILKSVDDSKLPNWTGFNTLLARDHVLVHDKIGYLPVIAASPTNPDTLQTILKRCLQISQELKIPAIVLVVDMGLYGAIQQIRWADKDHDFYKRVVIRPGEFHTVMSYLSVLGKKYGSAGLKDILVESNVVAHGSVNGVLDGKQYNRAMVAHKTTLEAMEFLRFRSYLSSLDEEKGKQIVTDLKSAIAAFPSDMFWTVCSGPNISRILNEYNEFCDYQMEANENFKFWSSYISEVKLLLEFVRATRTGNFDQHLKWLTLMTPMFFAFDRKNYSRYISAYLQEMGTIKESHPFVAEHLFNGEFAGQRTTNYGFSAVAHDQLIEQTINRDVKTSGGIIGITLNQNAIQRWILSSSDRAAISRQCETLAGLHREPSSRKDLLPGIQARDAKLVDQIVDLVGELITDPFSTPVSDLVHIVSGLSVDRNTADDLLCSYHKGFETFDKFRSEIRSDDQALHNPISQLKLNTFDASKKNFVKEKGGGQLTDRKIFTRFILLGQRLEISLRDLLEYPLGPVSYPLTSSNGTLAKTPKSRLVQLVEKGFSITDMDISNPTDCALIIDGMVLLHGLTQSSLPKTMGMLASKIFNKIRALARQARRVDIVFDRYEKVTIKAAEHNRRKKNESSLSFSIIKPDTNVPKQWNKMLADSKSKNVLIRFLADQWMKEECNFKLYVAYDKQCDHRDLSGQNKAVDELATDQLEADTRLVLHAHHAAEEYSNVIIYSPDSDVVFITLSNLSFFPDLSSISIETGGKNSRIISISELHEAMGVRMAKALVAYHVFSGCDSVSAFTGKGKQKGFQLLKSSCVYQDAFVKLGSSFDLDRSVFDVLQKFVSELYGQECDDVNTARYNMFCLCMDEDKLPPCRNSLYLHAQRANYQTCLYRMALDKYVEAPSINDHGWLVDENEVVTIKWIDGPAAPPQILKFDRCRCTTGCNTKHCTCNKNGIHCTDMCGCAQCKNSSQTSSEKTIEEYNDGSDLSDDDDDPL